MPYAQGQPAFPSKKLPTELEVAALGEAKPESAFRNALEHQRVLIKQDACRRGGAVRGYGLQPVHEAAV